MLTNTENFTEITECPICIKHGYKRTLSKKKYSFEEFKTSVTKCNNCSLWILSPRLPESAMIELYQSDDYFHEGEGGYDDYEDQKTSLSKTFRKLLKNVRRDTFVSGGLLEIGTGDGLLLKEAQGLFTYRAGMDFSEQSVKKASPHADEMFTGGLESLPSGYLKEKEIFTVIATNVIEHVYDPVAFVKRIYDELPKGGVLVLAAPNMNSLWRKALKKRWPSFKLPEHIYYYDKESLTALMKATGFELTKQISCPHYFPVKTLAKKAGFKKQIPDSIGHINVRLDGIMAAVAGVK